MNKKKTITLKAPKANANEKDGKKSVRKMKKVNGIEKVEKAIVKKKRTRKPK